MAIISKPELETYQYGVQVRKGRQLYMVSEKKIYFGEWLIGNNRPPIIIIEMNKLSDREAPFYLAVNGHENIIRTFGSVGNSANLTILVQEYAPQGDLADCLMDNQFHFNQLILLPMFVQIADAMSYVAKNRIVHGDLGCRNVLVFRVDSNRPRNNLVKITDFGLARWIDQPPADEDKIIVPVRYCATEILRDRRHTNYSEKSDVYSMGVLIWEALSNSEIPYSSDEKDEVVIRKKLNHERLPQPKGSDRQLYVLMNSCWHRDPQQRPTFDEIKEKLADMKITEIPFDLITDPSHKTPLLYAYQLDIDVKITRLLNDGDFLIHDAEWITREEGPIVVIERKEEPSEHEQFIYSTFKNHPHIIHTYGFVENDRRSFMILQEQAPYGNLQALLESGEFQPSATVLVEIFTQIINAMIDIVNQGYIHGDLRCENIFVFQMHPTDPKQNSVKLANFNLAHPNDASYSDDRRVNVPMRFCALEILRSAGRSYYSEFSDVYAMGVLMWEASSRGRRPYDSSETKGEVRQRKLNGERLSKPLLCHPLVWAIMEDCWHNEPQLRYNFRDMKKRFTNIDQPSVEPYQYELNKDVKQKRLLHGRFYEADWIPKRNPPIVLLTLDGPTAEHEASLHMQFQSHPHIIHTYGLVKNDQQLLMLLQERTVHGDLQTLIQNRNFQPSPLVLKEIFLQIVDAMIHLAENNVVHGSLCCANVLVFEMDSSEAKRNLVKLTNFSLARRKDQSSANYLLPASQVRYSAPEIFRSTNGSDYSEFSDVYSMGVLMWEAFSEGEIPYGRRASDKDVRQEILNDVRLTQPKMCPGKVWTLIQECFLKEPSIRWNFKGLKVRIDETVFKPVRRMSCSNCNNKFAEHEIENHQKLCLRPITPVETPDPYVTDFPGSHDNPGYKRDVEEGHVVPIRPKRRSSNDSDVPAVHNVPTSRQEPPPPKRKTGTSFVKPVRSSPCIYCNDPISDGQMDNHLSICPVKKRFSAIKPELTPSLETCNICRKQVPSNQMTNHRTKCKPSVIINEPSRKLMTQINVQEPTPPRQKSFLARICPCLFN